MKLYKYLCKGCNTTIGPTNEIIRKCEDCSGLLEKLELSAEDWIDFAFYELENANYHNQTELPEKLFNRIKDSNLLAGDEQYELELARIIAEEFYKNF